MKYIFMKTKYYVALVTLLILSDKYAVAQTNSAYSQIIPPSPTSVQFQRYGDYPVSYFTGVPDITIPIYTIQEGDITVPITLTYHASGTRADDVSGFVGLGWTLNTGGMISRTINGLPDEASTFKLFPQKAQDIDVTYGTVYQDMKYMEDGTYDHEYDMYSYSFLGKSGKYLWVPSPDSQPFIFQKNTNLLFNGANVITDENGLTYTFGTASHAVESQDYQDRWSNKSADCTWHLSGIQSAKYPGFGVAYVYQSGQTYAYNKNSSQVIFDDYTSDYYAVPSIMMQYSADYGGTSPYQSYTLVRHFTTVVKEIDFSHGKIVFNQDPGTKMLTSIEIYDSNNTLVKKVELTINAFATTHTLNEFSNYKLQSLAFKDVANNAVETYSFHYFDQDVNDAKPRAFDPATGKDYWGFYNGDDGRTSDLSHYSLLTRHDNDMPTMISLGGNANKAATGVEKTYVLDKITYPTGGYTTFDFESNRVNLGWTSGITGGLRIKTISNYTASGQLATQKNYTYPIEGYAEVTPDNNDFINTTVGVLNGDATFRRLYISENSSIDYSPQGSSVVYPQVMETDGNYTTTYNYDHDNAYTYDHLTYGAYNSAYFLLPMFYSFPEYFKPMNHYYKPWNFGNLLSKVTTGPHYFRSEVNEYEELVTDTVRDFIMTRRWSAECGAGANCPTGYNPSSYETTENNYGYSKWYYADHYYLSGGKRLKKTTTGYYTAGSGGDQLTTEKNYFYDNVSKPFIVNRTTTKNSRNETITTNLKFPYDYPAIHPYDDMVTLNYISPVIEQKVTNTTLGKEVSKSVTNYDYFSNVTHAWLPYTQFMGPATIQSSSDGNTLETDITVNAYDNVGNVRQVTGRDGIITTYLYGYNNKYPVAKIVGKDYASVSAYITQSILDNPSSDAALRTHLSMLRTALTDAQVSTYTYKPLVGMTSATDPKGQTSYYEYDAYQRLVNIKDQDGKILKHNEYHYRP